jgi:hypothetical protein
MRPKSKQRWKQMGAMGACYPNEAGQSVLVKTQKDGEAFFRAMSSFHTLRTPINTSSADHAWLLWLVQGHHAYAEMCPAGVDHFQVYQNSDIGYKGTARGFAVVATGSRGYPREFSFKRALLGEPKDDAEKIRIAFRKAIQDQVSFWKQTNFRSGLRCPVFGNELQFGATHADHDPPFKNLVLSFCRDHKVLPENISVEDAQVGKKQQWTLKEPWLSAWGEYHRLNARLQLVSIEGHLELDRQRREKERLEQKLGGTFALSA